MPSARSHLATGTRRASSVAVAAARVAAAARAAAAVAAEAVEQAAHRPRAGLGDPAQDAREGVLRAVPRVLVGPGRVADLFAEGGVAVGVPARVVPAQDPVVVA